MVKTNTVEYSMSKPQPLNLFLVQDNKTFTTKASNRADLEIGKELLNSSMHVKYWFLPRDPRLESRSLVSW